MSAPIFAVYHSPRDSTSRSSFSLVRSPIGLTLLVIPYAQAPPGRHAAHLGRGDAGGHLRVRACFFLAYGVVPHQWLTHADTELNWRPDKILTGPKVGGQGLLAATCPFDDHLPGAPRHHRRRHLRASSSACRSSSGRWWQNRGKKKPRARARRRPPTAARW